MSVQTKRTTEYLRGWRNWQTHYFEGVANICSCGFKSHSSHQKNKQLIWLLIFLSKPTKKAWHVINALAHCM